MWRSWISGLAVLGMLLHVAVSVRHHQMMGGSSGAVSALATDAGVTAKPILVIDGMVICHTGSGGSDEGGPAKHKPHCPLCNIATASTALVSGEWVPPYVPVAARIGQISERDQRIDVIRRLRPPSRAPPVQIV